MKEEKYMKMTIGGKEMKLKKIDHRTWRRLSTRDSKYLFYYSGDSYYMLPKVGSEKQRKTQIIKSWKHLVEINQNRFLKNFTWIAMYQYNTIIDLPQEQFPLEIRQWIRSIQRIMDGGVTDFEYHQIEKTRIPMIFKKVGRTIKTNLQGAVRDLSWYWAERLIRGDLKLKKCANPDCKKIFEPANSLQKYCSHQCRAVINTRAYAKRKKERISEEKILT